MALTIFWLWNRNSELRHDLKNSTEQPDTIWVNKPFVPKVEFPKIQLPKMVFLYQIDSVPIERIEYVDRVVTIIQKDSTKIEYNELNNYNFDLLTGNMFTIGNVFNPNVDYLKVISNYVNYKISQNKELYYKDVVVDIPEDQAFYLTDEGIVIYFGVDEIAPKEFGIPRFTMEYKKFAPYINPRFYCTPENIYTAMRLKSNYRR